MGRDFKPSSEAVIVTGIFIETRTRSHHFDRWPTVGHLNWEEIQELLA